MPVTPIRMEDLPLPLGPMIAQASPSATVNVASCTATTFPYATDRFRTASATPGVDVPVADVPWAGVLWAGPLSAGVLPVAVMTPASLASGPRPRAAAGRGAGTPTASRPRPAARAGPPPGRP